MKTISMTLAAAILLASPAAHAHKLIKPGIQSNIARKAFSASPTIEWNRLDQKEGKYQEIWTVDGDELNRVMFFGGVPVGEALFKERSKEQPLPKVSAGMLITDIPSLLESTYRAQGRTARMTIEEQYPAVLDGKNGIRFVYSYVGRDDEVERKGEAFGAVVDGRLFLVNYEAPRLFFFDKDLANFRQIATSLRFNF